jgi:hypothetical protein
LWTQNTPWDISAEAGEESNMLAQTAAAVARAGNLIVGAPGKVFSLSASSGGIPDVT